VRSSAVKHHSIFVGHGVRGKPFAQSLIQGEPSLDHTAGLVRGWDIHKTIKFLTTELYVDQ
jgi:hypothetical protein